MPSDSQTADESPGRVGPIIFSNETAREQLLNDGIVATFRTDERTTGETHARWERTGEKKCDVIVRRVCETDIGDPDDLPYFSFATMAEWSGFGTPESWREAILEVHGDVDQGIIYEVELVENELLACASCEAPAPWCVCEGGDCPHCHGKGYIINCVDDLCHAQGSCMHGDDKDCPLCSGRGVVYPKRVPIGEVDDAA